MNPSEAEIQVLASLRGAEIKEQSTDRAALEKGGERYWIFLEDWSDAFSSLVAKGLIEGDEAGDRLTFLQGDMNALDLPAGSFDAAISLDTLYWVADLADTLARVARTIKPGGQIGIFMLQGRSEGDPPEILEADNTRLAQALSKSNLRYQAHDYTAQNAEFWKPNKDAAAELRDDFEAEGNGFIAASLIREADEEFLPAIEAGTLTRYLYHVRL